MLYSLLCWVLFYDLTCSVACCVCVVVVVVFVVVVVWCVVLAVDITFTSRSLLHFVKEVTLNNSSHL